MSVGPDLAIALGRQLVDDINAVSEEREHHFVARTRYVPRPEPPRRTVIRGANPVPDDITLPEARHEEKPPEPEPA